MYIGNYDREKYERKNRDYQTGLLKSNPNGKIWCLVREDTSIICKHPNGKDDFTITYRN
ncbi:MAG: hypothetical protein H0X03_09325 [Nitrosopumilus sp.]|nr:hypothetical protein [Nitrosopumilus sp.]